MCYAPDATERLSILTELVDSPIIEEFCNAVGNDSSRKAHGRDGISPEIIKCIKSTTLEPLYALLYLC